MDTPCFLVSVTRSAVEIEIRNGPSYSLLDPEICSEGTDPAHTPSLPQPDAPVRQGVKLEKVDVTPPHQQRKTTQGEVDAEVSHKLGSANVFTSTRLLPPPSRIETLDTKSVAILQTSETAVEAFNQIVLGDVVEILGEHSHIGKHIILHCLCFI